MEHILQFIGRKEDPGTLVETAIEALLSSTDCSQSLAPGSYDSSPKDGTDTSP